MYQDNSMNDGFLRQRRNLIISTLFVFFIHFTTIEIDKVSIFGISFDIIKKSDDILYGMYLIWGYFFIRYIQYFYDYGFNRFFNLCSNVYDNNTTPKVAEYIELKEPNAINFKEQLNHKRIKDNNYVYKGKTDERVSETFGHSNKKFELKIPKIIY